MKLLNSVGVGLALAAILQLPATYGTPTASTPLALIAFACGLVARIAGLELSMEVIVGFVGTGAVVGLAVADSPCSPGVPVPVTALAVVAAVLVWLLAVARGLLPGAAMGNQLRLVMLLFLIFDLAFYLLAPGDVSVTALGLPPWVPALALATGVLGSLLAIFAPMSADLLTAGVTLALASVLLARLTVEPFGPDGCAEELVATVALAAAFVVGKSVPLPGRRIRT